MIEPTPLLAAYRAVVCDLDGVVYRGSQAIPFAVSALAQARGFVPVTFATNNASRHPDEVAAALCSIGLETRGTDVLTSAQAGAARLARDFPAGTPVLAVGGPGVAAAVAEAGLTPVTGGTDAPAVLQGWGREVTVGDLATASIAVARGARWVATNTDRTLPTAAGLVPGNGTLVAAVREASGGRPEVVGKPSPDMLHEAARRLGVALAGVLVIGDRLDTDIAAAVGAGIDSLWVLTGVHGLADLAGSAFTPTYAAADLRAVHQSPPVVARDAMTWTTSGLTARVNEGATGVEIDSWGRPDIPDPNALVALGFRVLVDLRGDGCPAERLAVLGESFDASLH